MSKFLPPHVELVEKSLNLLVYSREKYSCQPAAILTVFMCVLGPLGRSGQFEKCPADGDTRNRISALLIHKERGFRFGHLSTAPATSTTLPTRFPFSGRVAPDSSLFFFSSGRNVSRLALNLARFFFSLFLKNIICAKEIAEVSET